VEAHRVVRRRGSHIFSRQSAHRWRQDCQPYVPASLYPPERFLLLISVRGWVDPKTIVRLEGLGKLKNNNDLFGNRPRELSQRTTLPRAPDILYKSTYILYRISWEVIVSAILSEKVYIYMCPIPNGLRDRVIALYRRTTRHVLTPVAKCIDVDGGLFENVLY
jgi:hypothetical protein